MNVTITRQMLEGAKTPNGGYSRSQVSLAKAWTNELLNNAKHPIKRLAGLSIPEEDWKRFVDSTRKEAKKAKERKRRVEKRRKKEAGLHGPVVSIYSKEPKAKKTARSDFYYSDEWRKLRYRVLRNSSGKCFCCGRSQAKHGVVLHVDHIKPRSKHPELSLDYNNLQILCEDCNLGKSNLDDTDWRATDTPSVP